LIITEEAECVVATAAACQASLDEKDVKELMSKANKRNCNFNPAVEIKGECWNINSNCRAVLPESAIKTVTANRLSFWKIVMSLSDRLSCNGGFSSNAPDIISY